MSEPFIAEVRMFAGNFAPRGWAFCDGQLLPIAQNTALFSLIGTIYGGDGRTTTALPDLQGRTPMHPGRGPGLTSRRVGQRVGSGINAPTGDAVTAINSVGRELNYVASNKQQTLTRADQAGSGSPTLSVHFIIALQGLYPSRG